MIYINNSLPGGTGGDANYWGAQIRGAINDRTSIVVNKLGYYTGDGGTSGAATFGDGFGDVGVGLKFNILRDHARQRLASFGINYEVPVGDGAALQGSDGGDIIAYLSLGAQLGRNMHLISVPGVRIGLDNNRSNFFRT